MADTPATEAFPRGELVVGLVGLVLALGVVAVLLADGVGGSSAPELDAEVSMVTAVGSGWAVEVEVRNVGGSAAQQVTVVGELLDGDTIVEDAEATADYVPADSSTTVVLRFDEDPAAYELQVGAAGFQPV